MEAAAAPRDIHACVSRALSYLIPSRINRRRRPTAPRKSPVVEGRAESVASLCCASEKLFCFLKPERIYQAVFSSKNSTAFPTASLCKAIGPIGFRDASAHSSAGRGPRVSGSPEDPDPEYVF